MHTQNLATLGTGPPANLGHQKFPNTCVPDQFQVFNHAHSIFGVIAFIDVLDLFTWERFTFKTKSKITIDCHFAISYFTAVGMRTPQAHFRPASQAAIFGSVVCAAQMAVHPTNCD